MNGVLGQTSTGNGGYRIYYEYTQDTVNNKSTVTAYFQILKNYGTSFNQNATKTINIDGSQVHSSVGFDSRNLPTGVWTSIASGTKIINHNNDGTCNSVNISIYCATGTGGYGTINASGSFTPKTIQRQAIIKDIRSATESELSPLSVEDTFFVEYEKYIDNSDLTLLLKDNNGETYGSWDLDESNQITLSTSELNKTFNFMTDKNEYTFSFVLITTILVDEEQMEIGSSQFDLTLGIYNANPVFGGLSIEPFENPALVGNDTLVRTLKLKATVSEAIPQKNATIKEYTIKCGTETKKINQSGIIIFDNITSNTVKVEVLDSRGNSSEEEVTYSNFVEYTKPVITKLIANRNQNGIAKETTLDFEGKFYNGVIGNNQNNPTAKIYYKQYQSSSDYIEIQSLNVNIVDSKVIFNGIINGNESSEGFTLGTAYDIKAIIFDNVTTDEETTLLDSGKPAMSIHKNGISFGAAYDETLGGEMQITGTAYYNGEELGTGGGGGDTLPVGTIVEYDGDEIPDGYEAINEVYTFSNQNSNTVNINIQDGVYEISIIGETNTGNGILMKVNSSTSVKSNYIEIYASSYGTPVQNRSRVGRGASSGFCLSGILTKKGSYIGFNAQCIDGDSISSYGSALWTNISNVTSLQFYLESSSAIFRNATIAIIKKM